MGTFRPVVSLVAVALLSIILRLPLQLRLKIPADLLLQKQGPIHKDNPGLCNPSLTNPDGSATALLDAYSQICA